MPNLIAAAAAALATFTVTACVGDVEIGLSGKTLDGPADVYLHTWAYEENGGDDGPADLVDTNVITVDHLPASFAIDGQARDGWSFYVSVTVDVDRDGQICPGIDLDQDFDRTPWEAYADALPSSLAFELNPQELGICYAPGS